MHEVSSYDDLAAKVESLTLQLDKMNVNAVSPSPSCELCGIVGHNGNGASWEVLLSPKSK